MVQTAFNHYSLPTRQTTTPRLQPITTLLTLFLLAPIRGPRDCRGCEWCRESAGYVVLNIASAS